MGFLSWLPGKLSRAASRLVVDIPGPSGTIDDWWSYIVVSVCAGEVLIDPESLVLYRQHRHNLIGSPPSTASRTVAAIRRGPDAFMGMMRRHVRQLASHYDKLSDAAQRDVARIDDGLAGGVGRRVVTCAAPDSTGRVRLKTRCSGSGS